MTTLSRVAQALMQLHRIMMAPLSNCIATSCIAANLRIQCPLWRECNWCLYLWVVLPASCLCWQGARTLWLWRQCLALQMTDSWHVQFLSCFANSMQVHFQPALIRTYFQTGLISTHEFFRYAARSHAPFWLCFCLVGFMVTGWLKHWLICCSVIEVMTTLKLWQLLTTGLLEATWLEFAADQH